MARKSQNKRNSASLMGSLAVSFVASAALAQAPATKPAAREATSDAEIIRAPDEGPVEPRVFSQAEIRRICAKYAGQLIAFYGDVWKVEGCKRRVIMDYKTVYEWQRKGTKVQDVERDVIAAIPEGEPLDLAMSAKSARSCKELEGKYVTYSSVDVYFVEKCEARLFPDWTTYTNHRTKHGKKKGEILALSLLEFELLKRGPTITSVMDEAFKALLSGEAGVEVIPVDEACQGVDGKLVSYYSRLYKIENCRKREIDEPDTYLRRVARHAAIKELKAEQWLSLPDGKPIHVENQTNQTVEKAIKARKS